MPSFRKSLVVEQFQRNYLKVLTTTGTQIECIGHVCNSDYFLGASTSTFAVAVCQRGSETKHENFGI